MHSLLQQDFRGIPRAALHLNSGATYVPDSTAYTSPQAPTISSLKSQNTTEVSNVASGAVAANPLDTGMTQQSKRRQATHQRKSQLKHVDPDVSQRRDRFSPSLSDSSHAVPYSPSPTSTTSSNHSNIQHERLPDAKHNIKMKPHNMQMVGGRHEFQRTESSVSDSPASTNIISNQSEYSDSPETGSIYQLPPLEEDINFDGKVYSKNETFFSPPPMFSNETPPPFVLPQPVAQDFSSQSEVVDGMLNKTRPKKRQASEEEAMGSGSNAMRAPGAADTSMPTSLKTADQSYLQRGRVGKTAGSLKKKESSV